MPSKLFIFCIKWKLSKARSQTQFLLIDAGCEWWPFLPVPSIATPNPEIKRSPRRSFREGNGNPLRVLAWRTPGTAEPGGLPSMGPHRVGHDWSDLAAAGDPYHSCFARRFFRDGQNCVTKSSFPNCFLYLCRDNIVNRTREESIWCPVCNRVELPEIPASLIALLCQDSETVSSSLLGMCYLSPAAGGVLYYLHKNDFWPFLLF